MNSIVLVFRVVLVVVFATAALAKLADLGSSSDTVEAFGVPQPWARYGGTGLPFGELTAAVLLLLQPTARWGAVLALVLLLVFTGGVALALSQGRTPDCNCFGQVSSEQISWRTLVRNGVLILVTALTVWKAPGAALSGWTTSHVASNLVAGLAVITSALLAIAAFHFRQRTRALSAATAPSENAGEFGDALRGGAEAPDFKLVDRSGALVSRDTLLDRGLPVIFIFASPSCGPCSALMPELVRWNGALSERITFVVVESGVEDNSPFREQLGLLDGIPVLFEPARELAEAYRARATPTGISISASGRISSPPMAGRDQIEVLIRTVLQTGGEPPVARPEMTMPVRT